MQLSNQNLTKHLETTLVSPEIRDTYDASQDLERDQVLKSNFKGASGKQMISL